MLAILHSFDGMFITIVNEILCFKSYDHILLIFFLFSFVSRINTSRAPEPAYQNVVSGYELHQHTNESFLLKYNQGSLQQFQLAYETWGTLNAKKSNAILIFTGLSASSHAKSHKVCSATFVFNISYRENMFSGEYKARLVGTVHWIASWYRYGSFLCYLL
jgi:hypothetical protein